MSLKVFKHIQDAQKWNGVGNINNAIDSLIEAIIELSKGAAAPAQADPVTPSVMVGAALDETHEPSVWPTVQTDSEEVRALKAEFAALGTERKVFSVEVPSDLPEELVKEAVVAAANELNREVSIPTPVTAEPPAEEAKEEPKPAPKKPSKAK